ncbi:MAG: hypothetical protein LUC41_06895 [Clostridiales bacterium]|nr:hypothetical protein [Clostridiales bacterium]
MNALFLCDAQVLSQKKADYQEYRTVKKEMQDLLIAQKTVRTILGADYIEEEQKKREQSL